MPMKRRYSIAVVVPVLFVSTFYFFARTYWGSVKQEVLG